MTTLLDLLRVKTIIVWFGLTAATLLSFSLGAGENLGADTDHQVASALILAVALTKVRFVGRWFMELREAPAVLARLFDAYCLLCFVLLIGFYLAA
jgi:hypothetical protein